MKAAIDVGNVAPGVRAAMDALERYAGRTVLEASLLELVKLRASQINGCAYCIGMHMKDARARGEREQRLYGLMAWREAAFFTERERAALVWTEAVTSVSQGHVPDDVYGLARQHFSEKELLDLTMAIVAISGYNRLAITFQSVPGIYQPGPQHDAGGAAGVEPATEGAHCGRPWEG